VTDDEAFSWLDSDAPSKSATDPLSPEPTPPPPVASGTATPPRPGASAPATAGPSEDAGRATATAVAAEPPAEPSPAATEDGGSSPPATGEEPASAASLRAAIRRLKRQLADLEAMPSEHPSMPPEDGDEGDDATPIADQERQARRSLSSSRVFARHLSQFGSRRRAERVDAFGLDPVYESRLRRVLDFMHSTYFRVEVDGIDHVPAAGRCLIVANHSGGPVPYDGLMLRTAMRREHPSERDLRWLTEDFIHHLPFVGTAMSRLGAVRACQQNAQRLLSQGCLVAVFPEGAKGIGRLFKNRYRLRRFGRGGYVRLCIRTDTPLVPCAIVGPEEASPTLFKLETVARYLGMPHLPITPTFPLLGLAGLLPAPTKWKLRFGEPVRFDDHPPEAADDEVLVGRLSDRIRATIQAMLDDTLAKRRSVFFG